MEYIAIAISLGLGGFVGFALATFFWFQMIERLHQRNDRLAVELAALQTRYEEVTADTRPSLTAVQPTHSHVT